MDPHFPLIALNHEQVRDGTTGGYLLAKNDKFADIVDCLLNVDQNVLADLTTRMTNGERVKPQTDGEKQCFQLINDLDHVGQHVKGSITNKKYM